METADAVGGAAAVIAIRRCWHGDGGGLTDGKVYRARPGVWYAVRASELPTSYGHPCVSHRAHRPRSPGHGLRVLETGSRVSNKAFIVVGLGFGDEGKGTIVDHLCRVHDADRVIRFNGGAQASHAVVLPDGTSHCFHQFGSGTFAGAKTHLSKWMMVNPAVIFDENAHLIELGINGLPSLSVHEDALITTSFHVAANRMREDSRGKNRHGSCGLGIGETMSDFIDGHGVFARDLKDRDRLRDKLEYLRLRKYFEFKDAAASADDPWMDAYKVLSPKYTPHEIDHLMDIYEIFAECVEIRSDDSLDGVTVFEGAQGVLLDQDLPPMFQPHTTWSKTTSENALRILEENKTFPEVTVTGVLRAYATRHGAGPFPTFSEDLTVALRDPHNPTNPWQGGFKCGHLDLQLLRWAAHYEGMAGLDQLAVTCLDQIGDISRVRMPVSPQSTGITSPVHPALSLVTVPTEDLLSVIQDTLELPVAITSYGPSYDDKREGILT